MLVMLEVVSVGTFCLTMLVLGLMRLIGHGHAAIEELLKESRKWSTLCTERTAWLSIAVAATRCMLLLSPSTEESKRVLRHPIEVVGIVCAFPASSD